MATGRVDVSGRSVFHKSFEKQHDCYRNPNRGADLIGDRGRDATRAKGLDSLSRVIGNVGDRANGFCGGKEYGKISYRNKIGSEMVGSEKLEVDKGFRDRKRKFSSIVWNDEKEITISSGNRIPSMSTAFAWPKFLGEVVSDEIDAKHRDADRIQCLESSITEFHRVGVSAESTVTESPQCFSPLMPDRRCVNTGEEAEQMEEEFVRSWNITTSRWASGGNSPGEECFPEDGNMHKRNKKNAPTDSPSRTVLDGKTSSIESGEFLREDSEGDRAESSVTDEVSFPTGRSSGDECSRNESDSNDCMEINNGDYQLDSDSEDGNAVHLSRLLPPSPQRSENMRQECRSVFEFERLHKINEGAYGVVYKARDKKTGEIVALKKMKMKTSETEGFPMSALREINILLSFHHPSIVDVKEVVMDDFGTVYMVMEYMEHDISRVNERRRQPFSISEVKALMLQLLDGVQHLHHNWVMHRDLKTSNLLLNDKGELKICDFGLSRQYASPLKPYTQLVVTLWYR